MLRKFEYTPRLGWSVSRYDSFSICKRQYFYNYYAKFDLETDLRAINSLKNLTSVPLEIGNITHKVIKTLLDRVKKTPEPIDNDRFMDFVRRKTLETVAGKKFSEVYYRELDDINAEEEILPAVLNASGNLLGSDRFLWLLSEARARRDEWIVDPEGYGECRIDNLKAYCKVDFLFPVGDELVILDWKTGKESRMAATGHQDKHGRQMRGYVAWAHFQFEHDIAKIKPFVAYLLPNYRERSYSGNEFDIEDFADTIRAETEEMYGYCRDVDENFPKAKDEFEMTHNLTICKFCNFRELCRRTANLDSRPGPTAGRDLPGQPNNRG
jgi:hypothetical protein